VVCQRALVMMVALVPVRVVEWVRVLCALRTRSLREEGSGSVAAAAWVKVVLGEEVGSSRLRCSVGFGWGGLFGGGVGGRRRCWWGSGG
jgi:hypothetical protein